jgi:hypothetical protein
MLTLTTLLPQGAVAEPMPGAFSSVYRSGDAVWLRKEHGDTFMYFAGATHSINLMNQKMATFAFADRSKCAVAETKHLKVIACSGSGHAKKIDPSHFEFDPLMETARLDYEDAHVRWMAKQDIQPDAWPYADPSFGAFASASVSRYSRATGRLLGTDIEGHSWMDMAFLGEGMYAFAWITTPVGRYRVDPATNTVHYRFRFEIPR